MTTSTLSKKTATATILTLALLSATPAFGASQDDVRSCRAAMTVSSNINMNDYRLRFERSEGFRMETIYLKAIPKRAASKTSAKAFRFTCTLNRNQVVAVNHTRAAIRLAAK